jgi:hypothetical protein
VFVTDLYSSLDRESERVMERERERERRPVRREEIMLLRYGTFSLK